MAYIVGKTQAVSDGAATTLDIELPEHQTDDLLMLVATQDVGSGTLSITTATGWTGIGTQAASSGVRQYWFYKVAASGAETAPVVSSTLSDELSATCIIIRDADTTTPIDSNAKTDSVAPITSPSLTPSTDNCLLIYSCGMDGSSQRVVSDNDQIIFFDRNDDSTSTSAIIGYTQQQTAASATSVVFHSTVADGGTNWIIAIKNKSGGNVMPRMTQSSTTLARLGAIASDTDLTYGLLSDVTGTIASKTVNTAGYTTVGGIANQTYSPGGLYQQFGSNISMSDNWWGMTMALASTVDMTGKLAVIEWGMLSSVNTPIGKDGFIFVFADSTGEWVAFRLATLKQTKADVPYCNVIAVDTATPLDASGSIDWTDITKIGIGYHRTGSTTTSRYMGIKTVLAVDTVKLVGGSNSSPVNAETLGNIFWGNGNPFVIEKQASGQIFSRVPVQIGDGTISTYYKAIGASFEFPDNYSPAAGQLFWNVPESNVDLTVYASASDTMDFSAGIFKSSSKQKFIIHASSSTSATYDFSGAVFVGFEVTGKDGVIFNNATFTRCYKITNGDFNSCIIRNSPDTIAVTTTDLSNITDCSFTSVGTGHAIEITTPGTYSFVGNTFTNYAGTNGTTGNEAIYNNSGGAVTINISGGGGTPTIRNGTGASTTVNNSVTVKITVKDIDTDAAIEDARVLLEAGSGGDLTAGDDILTGLTDASGILQDTGFSYTSDQPVTGRVRRATVASGTLYKSTRISGTITSSGLDLTVFLIADE